MFKSRAHRENALVSGPTGTWPLIDQELQTSGLAPKIKTQRGCSLPTSHLPTTAPLSHTQNKALSVLEQGRQHKLDNPNQSTLSLTAPRLGQEEREGSREVRLWSVQGKSESDSQSSATRAPFESLQGGPNSWTVSREGERISQPESETKRHPPLNFPLASLGRSRSSGATVVTERRKTRPGH